MEHFGCERTNLFQIDIAQIMCYAPIQVHLIERLTPLEEFWDTSANLAASSPCLSFPEISRNEELKHPVRNHLAET